MKTKTSYTPTSLNSPTINSTVGGVMNARTDAAKGYITKTGGVDPNKIKTKTGTKSSTGTKGRTVDVKIKGIQ